MMEVIIIIVDDFGIELIVILFICFSVFEMLSCFFEKWWVIDMKIINMCVICVIGYICCVKCVGWKYL